MANAIPLYPGAKVCTTQPNRVTMADAIPHDPRATHQLPSHKWGTVAQIGNTAPTGINQPQNGLYPVGRKPVGLSYPAALKIIL